MITPKRFLFFTLLGLILMFGPGPTIAGDRPSSESILAEIDGTVISDEEVAQGIGAPLAKLEADIYQLKRQKMESIINEKLLAKEAAKRGISVPALLDAEVTNKVGLVSEQEIETFYQSNKSQFKAEDQAAHEQIRAHLQNRKLALARETFIRSLRSQTRVAVYLKAPPVFRAQLRAEGGPTKGPADAPITIVKFEDFHCPFCKRVQPTFNELLVKYDGKVKIIHRDFPLDQLHAQARGAHEAGRCAEEQGKFWAYHDILYSNAPKASPDQLQSYAMEIGLDMAAFDQCVKTGKYRAAVQLDVDEGTRAGVSGTPAFFINGRPMTGAQPVEKFVQMIDEELARGPTKVSAVKK